MEEGDDRQEKEDVKHLSIVNGIGYEKKRTEAEKIAGKRNEIQMTWPSHPSP